MRLFEITICGLRHNPQDLFDVLLVFVLLFTQPFQVINDLETNSGVHATSRFCFVHLP